MLSTCVSQLRRTTPLVQCLTNAVVTQFTANALLAAGAAPAMVDTPEEAAEFAQVASAVLINLGTPTAPTYSAMREAIRSANHHGVPWVLDPVACGGPAARSDFAADIARRCPAAIRANPSEIRALAAFIASRQVATSEKLTEAPSGGRGVDSTDAVESALPAAVELAAATGAVIAVSGARDLIVSRTGDCTRITWLTSGDPLMQRVVGTGCSLGALTAAYLGINRSLRGESALSLAPVELLEAPMSAHDAVLAAHAHAGAAGIAAARQANAPGSFAQAWIDYLYTLSPEEISDVVTIDDH